MALMQINIANRVATYSRRGGAVVCGNTDYVAEFAFDSEWDGHDKKTARFIWGGKFTDVEFTGNMCPMPAVHRTDSLSVGVYAGNLCTTTPAVIPCHKSILCGTNKGHEGNEARYASEAQEAAKEAKEAAEVAQHVADQLIGPLGSLNAANALIGTASGEVVTLKDVSPVGHNLQVEVKRGNLLNMRTATSKEYIVGDCTITVGDDGKITASGTPTSYVGLNTGARVDFEKLGVYTLAVFGTSVNMAYQLMLYDKSGELIDAVTISDKYNTSATFDLNNYPATSYGVIVIKRNSDNVEMAADCYLQIEEGPTATACKPYIEDVEAVKLLVQGKNLLPFPYRESTRTVAGVTFTVYDDGTITMSGTATEQVVFYLYHKDDHGRFNIAEPMTLSGISAGAYSKGYSIQCSVDKDGTTSYVNDTGSGAAFEKGLRINSIYLIVRSGFSFTNEIIRPQLEVGGATEYEPYTEPVEYEQGEDIASIDPSMTITTDTAGAVLEVKYNRDINSAFAELQRAIISMGGNI